MHMLIFNHLFMCGASPASSLTLFCRAGSEAYVTEAEMQSDEGMCSTVGGIEEVIRVK